VYGVCVRDVMYDPCVFAAVGLAPCVDTWSVLCGRDDLWKGTTYKYQQFDFSQESR
jgi:hypothetical protein